MQVPRAALIAALAASCAPAPRVVTIAVPAAPAATSAVAAEEPRERRREIDYLEDGAAERVTMRTRVITNGHLRLSERGPIAGGDGERLREPVELPVIAQASDSVRVIAEGWGVRMLAWIDRSNLALAATREAVLSTAPDAYPDPARGARVAAGIVLTLEETLGEARKVGAQTKSLHAIGWLPASAVGDVYERAPFAAEPYAGGSAREGAAVLASPNGPEIARFDAYTAGGRAFAFEVEAGPGAPPGFQRIRFADAARLGSREVVIEVRGLIATTDYSAKPPNIGRLTGASRSRPPLMVGLRRGTIGKGTPIFPRADAVTRGERRPRVGLALEEVRVYADEHQSDGLRDVKIAVAPFGFVHAAVRDDAIVPEVK